MDLKLKVLLGKNAGQLLPVAGPKFFIGRAEDCQLRPKSDLVSRHHCVLMVDDAFAAVRDFGSRNGTHVNGERVVGERELKAGDRLVIGALEFEVVLTETPAVTKRPRVHSVKEAAARTVAGPLQPAGDASQWLQDGDSSGGETIADTAALTMAETEQLEVPPATTVPSTTPASPAPTPTPPAAVPPSLATAETVHPGMASSETVIPPAAPATSTPAPTPPKNNIIPPSASVPPVASIPKAAETPAPAASEPVARAEPPQPSTPPPNYYVPPEHEPAQDTVVDGADTEPEPVKGKKRKAKPGKLPPTNKLNGEDSREAAADTLRKFFQRR